MKDSSHPPSNKYLLSKKKKKKKKKKMKDSPYGNCPPMANNYKLS